MAILLLAVFLLSAAQAELIPPARLSDWTPAVRTGVIGGIPTNRTRLRDVTQAPYNADNTGTTDASAAIQTAINAVTNGDVVYLPAGTYKLNSALNLSAGLDNFTIRGAGPAATVLQFQAAAGGIAFGASDSWSWPAPVQPTVTGGLTKNSTSITLSSAAEFSVGNLICIDFEDPTSNQDIVAGATIVFGVGGWDSYRPLRKQVTRIINKTANTLTISPGIYHSPPSGLGAKVWVAQLQHDSVGIEDLAIDMSSSTGVFPIMIQHANGCWVKNVKIVNIKNYGIGVFNSLQVEIRHCEIRDRASAGSNGAAILFNTNAGCLVEDNILYNVFPLLEVNASSSGNVFAYNVMENPAVNGVVLFGLDANHGAHNSFNLYEGNIAPNFITDGYFGSVSEDTVFRNWFHGSTRDNSAVTFTFALKRFTRDYSVVGNILGKTNVAAGQFNYGQPNIGNSESTGTAQPTANDFWADWGATATLTTRSSDTAGAITLDGASVRAEQLVTIRWGNQTPAQTFTAATVNGNVVSWTGGNGAVLPAVGTVCKVFMQAGGYQELDLDVEASTIQKGNYRYGTGGSAGSMSSLGTDTLPSSLFRTLKPSWFRDLPWPPFDPAAPNASDYERIPAGYRYIHGVDPPGNVPQGPSNLTAPGAPGTGDRPQGASPAPKPGGSAKPQGLTAKETEKTETASIAAKASPTSTPKAAKPKRKTVRKKSGGS